MKTFYIYGEDNMFSHEVEVEDGTEQPAMSSPWKPNVVDPKMQDAYFDGTGWVIIRKLELIPKAVLAGAAKSAAELAFRETLAGLRSGYSKFEYDTWDLQIAEAMAFDPEQPSPFLVQLAESRGQDVADLVEKIKAKSMAYRTAYAKHMGEYQKASSVVTDGEVVLTPELARMPQLRG